MTGDVTTEMVQGQEITTVGSAVFYLKSFKILPFSLRFLGKAQAYTELATTNMRSLAG
jgi:hypothetical protein